MYTYAWLFDNFNFYGHQYKNGELILKKDRYQFITCLKNTYIFYYLNNYIFRNIPDTERYLMFLKYITEMKKQVNKNYPKAKFIFVIYDINEPYHILKFTQQRIQQIKNLGIDVIILDEVFGNKLYTLEYQRSEVDKHPNAKAWQLIVPEIIKMEKM
ncbi:hypothetical protein IJG14_03540 [bacterium]|nr:hypothetical protein [bacterium]